MITVEEFQTYLNSFKKGCGEYTNEETIQIGIMFKKLPKEERDWQALVQILGLSCSTSAYKKRIYRYLKKTMPEEACDYINNYSEKQKVRDWYNAFRRDIREEVRIENLKEEIINAANKFKDLPTVKYQAKARNQNKDAILLLSDLHIGVECDNFYNRYNKDIAKARLEKLLDEVVEFATLNQVKTLHVLNLGDMIQGLIHTNARIENQMDVAEQIMIAGELISGFLNELQRAAPKVTYRSVYDNHSRAVANLNEHIEKEQFSRIIDWFIKERLKSSNIEFIENEIDGGIGELFVGNYKHVMFAHGHQDGRNSSMQNFIGLTREWVDYICLAHYHSPATKDYQGCKVFINGSIVGTESYAFGKRLFTKPSQKLLIFSNDSDTIQDIDISLE